VISHYMLQSNERNSYENTEYMPSQTECNTNKFERYYIEMKMTEIMNKRKYEWIKDKKQTFMNNY